MNGLFQRLDGEAGLTRLIDLRYERLLADDYLGEYFMGVDIDRLKAGLLAGESGADETDQAEIRAALKAARASVISEFKPNPAYDYRSKPF